MTTATAQPAAPVQSAARSGSHADARITFPHLVRAQWITLSSLRGTLVSLFLGIGLAVGLAGAFSLMISLSNQMSEGATALPDLTTMGTNTITVALCVAVLVAVSFYAKEHSTGAHRTLLAAAPRRATLIGAKAVVIAVSAFVAAVIALALSFAAVSIVYAGFGNPVLTGSFLDSILLPILGGAFYVAASAVFALGVSVLLRSETWGILLVLVYLLMLPTVLMLLPFDWAPTTAEYLLSSTGSQLAAPFAGFTGELAADLALTLAWPIAALGLGMAVESGRDA
ncbi:MAG: hypothetical protein ACTH0V_04365 [Microbacteriaceae bacterium]|uniref:hypothetical protein n=1 Tax=Microbacterium sp. TaxID=51671 RepID=UPI003F97C6A7